MGHVKTQIVIGWDFHEHFEFDQTYLTKNANQPFFRLQIHTSISIPHLLSFLTKRLNNGESCKGQKRMSSSGTNTKKKLRSQRKEKCRFIVNHASKWRHHCFFHAPFFLFAAMNYDTPSVFYSIILHHISSSTSSVQSRTLIDH